MVHVVRGPYGYVCECGKGRLRLWMKEYGKGQGLYHLESHVPPGEKDPQKFCPHSHEAVDDGDDTPLLCHYGSRNEDKITEYGLGREDEEVVPFKDYKEQEKPSRPPLDFLGVDLEPEDRRRKLNGEDEEP